MTLQKPSKQQFWPALLHILILKDRKYFRDCLTRSKKVRWHAGAVSRAKWHLAEVLDVQKKEAEYAQTLRLEAQSALDEMYSKHGDTPEYLKNASVMDLFDWAQPSFDGRWTGISLLPLVQKYYSVSTG